MKSKHFSKKTELSHSLFMTEKTQPSLIQGFSQNGCTDIDNFVSLGLA
jgi:hypothetical protein